MTERFILNREQILGRLGGDEEIFSLMAGLYLEEAESIVAALSAALAAGEAPALKREAHTVKGLLASFSDEVGVAAALVVEEQARSGLLGGLQPAVAVVQRRLLEVADVLRRELASTG